MGIISFVKGGVKELAIARPDEFKNHIVYKHPDPTVPMKAQLTVEADECAIFFRDGTHRGSFTPGRHTLDSSNIPFLGQLVDKFTGGNVFIAEVYFVTTREIPNLKFGGPVGKLRDPQSQIPVGLMVNGTFSLRVIDPVKLVIGLVGLQATDNEASTRWFKEMMLKVIRDRVAEQCVKKKWPLLDVCSGAYTEEIEQEVIAGMRQHVESYGIEVMRIGNFNLIMKEEDEKRLNKIFDNAAYMNMAGGIQGYQQMAAASAMMDAGEGMKQGGAGGGNMLAGAGLGVGFGMANQFAGAMQYPQQPMQPQAPPPGIPPTQPGGAAAVKCEKCQKMVAPGKFCAECGATMVAAGPKFCGGCGQPVPPGGKFCAGCGNKVA